MRSYLFAVLALCGAAPASAEVVASSETGFVIRLSAEVAASADETWRTLVTPAQWWNKAHTFSGDAANLYIDSQATGCFCEKLPAAKDAPAGRRSGSVEHMRLIHVDPGKVLRMSGSLGPLQSEALDGTMTITLKPMGGKTRILWEYVVGGYMRFKPDEIAPAVNKVLAEQLESLAAKLGPAAPRAEVKGRAGPTVSDPGFLGDAPGDGKGEGRAAPRGDKNHVEPTR